MHGEKEHRMVSTSEHLGEDNKIEIKYESGGTFLNSASWLPQGMSDSIFLASISDFSNRSRLSSLWPLLFGTSCCFIEFASLIGSRFDFDRGVEILEVKSEEWLSTAVAPYAYGFNYLRSQCAYDAMPGGSLASVYHLTQMRDQSDQPEEICAKVFVKNKSSNTFVYFWEKC
ncbi:hypothetical protein L7F22_046791 [Adiantum nelumboides]|nr:hypothetical protein [Adiantum nelumboides]